MQDKLEIHAVHLDIDDKIKQRIVEKIGGLDHYLPKHAKSSAHAEVYLKQTQTKHKQQFQCEVNLHLPHQTIVIKEDAASLSLAIDTTADRLKQSLQKYKEIHQGGKGSRHLFARFTKRNDQLPVLPQFFEEDLEA